MPLGFCLSDFCVSLFTVLLPLFIPYMSVLLRCPDQVSCCYSLGFLRTILSIVLTSAPISWWHPHFCFPLCISLFGSRFTWLCVHLGLPQASQTQHIPIWTHHHKPSSLLCCLFQWMAPPSTPPSYKPGSHPWLTQSPGPIGPASLLPGASFKYKFIIRWFQFIIFWETEQKSEKPYSVYSVNSRAYVCG